MRSAPVSRAFSRIWAQGTITPMLTTSKLLHSSTTETMFLPMSCTSPLTVAMTILPRERTSPPAAARAAFSASMKGSRWATACFMTRADLTTCGRNILPSPNRSPTTFMPAISGPSMTSMGRPPRAAISWRISSVSSTMYWVMPCTMAWVMRSCTLPLRQAWSASFLPPSSFRVWAISMSRSVAVSSRSGASAGRSSGKTGLRLSTTSSMRLRSSSGTSS